MKKVTAFKRVTVLLLCFMTFGLFAQKTSTLVTKTPQKGNGIKLKIGINDTDYKIDYDAMVDSLAANIAAPILRSAKTEAKVYTDQSVIADRLMFSNYSSSTFIQKSGEGSINNPYSYSINPTKLDSVFVDKNTATTTWAYLGTGYMLAKLPNIPNNAKFKGVRNSLFGGAGTNALLCDTTTGGATINYYINDLFNNPRMANTMIRFRTSYIANATYTGAWIYYERQAFPHVSSFNGLTGDIGGVSSFNGLTGNVIAKMDTAVKGSSWLLGANVGDYLELGSTMYATQTLALPSFRLHVIVGDKAKTYEVATGFVGIPVSDETGGAKKWLTLAPVSISDNYTIIDNFDVEIYSTRRQVYIRVRRKVSTGNNNDFGVSWAFQNNGYNEYPFVNNVVVGNDLAATQGIYSTTPVSLYRENILIDNKAKGGTYNTSIHQFPLSRIDMHGSIAHSIIEVSGNYTATIDDHTIAANAQNSAITVTLPDATTCKGRVYHVAKTDVSTNLVVCGNFSTSIIAALQLQSTGLNWIKIN